jgi:predicted AAA+ superfamily ATPase
MFKRKIYSEMLQWKAISNGKTALFIEGARRIGKSTVALEFAKNEYDDHLVVDFAKVGPNIRELFLNGLDDLTTFFRNLFLFTKKKPKKGRMVIIFDEIQLFPLARQAIKYLVQDGRYDYIETGSLISIKKNTKDILIPSEEYRIKMYPMDFEEFLWATGDEVTMDVARDAFNAGKGVGGHAHHEIMKSFRTYMAVGGMPQAVASFVAGETYAQIDFVKRNILALYEEDLEKHDSENNENASIVFKHLPEQLNRKNPIFKMSAIDKNARYKNYISAFNFIRESMIGNICTNVTVPDVAMELYRKSERFKLYMGDTGLLVTQIIKMQKSDELYQSLIADKLGINQGMIFENVVAQMLRAKGDDLFFHEFSAVGDDGKEKKFEMDFLLVRKNKICPIEVKSSSYRQHKSLDAFAEKYRLRIPQKYIVYTKDYQQVDDVTYIPIYMVPCI